MVAALRRERESTARISPSKYGRDVVCWEATDRAVVLVYRFEFYQSTCRIMLAEYVRFGLSLQKSMRLPFPMTK